jgi:tRNA (guanine-N7-)-methyltransferase
MGADFWLAVFGNPHPVEIEIGPGRGEVLLAFAATRRDTNFLAVEHSVGLAAALAARAAGRQLANVRVVAGDARCIVARLVPPASVAAFHVYFPDPWPKTRHRRRRLFDDPVLARAMARALVPGAPVHVATDLASLHELICRQLAAAGLTPGPPPPVRPLSKFERKYAVAGTYAATFVKTG